jgi:hypothetical protein
MSQGDSACWKSSALTVTAEAEPAYARPAADITTAAEAAENLEKNEFIVLPLLVLEKF